MSHRPEVILVHGLWHRPAHLDRLTAFLRAHGIGVHVPRLHRGSLTNDTASVQSVVDALPVAPGVLGHSYGGSVITGFDRVPSSHSPFISQPLRVGAVIMKTCPGFATG